MMGVRASLIRITALLSNVGNIEQKRIQISEALLLKKGGGWRGVKVCLI